MIAVHALHSSVPSDAAAQSYPQRGEPVIPLWPSSVDASSTFASSQDGRQPHEAEHLLDDGRDTAWFPKRDAGSTFRAEPADTDLMQLVPGA